MQGQLPPAAQEIYEEMQELQDEAEQVVAEKQAAQQQLAAAEDALNELATVDDGTAIYRQLGRLRTSADRAETRADLESSIERLTDRIESLEATEQELETEFENRKQDVKHLLGSAGEAGSGPAATDE